MSRRLAATTCHFRARWRGVVLAGLGVVRLGECRLGNVADRVGDGALPVAGRVQVDERGLRRDSDGNSGIVTLLVVA
jgi:hypothetical protein